MSKGFRGFPQRLSKLVRGFFLGLEISTEGFEAAQVKQAISMLTPERGCEAEWEDDADVDVERAHRTSDGRRSSHGDVPAGPYNSAQLMIMAEQQDLEVRASERGCVCGAGVVRLHFLALETSIILPGGEPEAAGEWQAQHKGERKEMQPV